jgi:hypothetical protein
MRSALYTLLANVAMLLVCAIAAPGVSLVCDPQAGAVTYTLTGPSWVPATVPAQPDGSLKLDISKAADGFSLMTVKACPSGPLDSSGCNGKLCCSPAVNLLLGAQSGTFPYQNGTVVWKEWWVPGK